MLGNMSFVFDEIRYELNDTEIDRNKNVGTSLIKSYASYSGDFTHYMENAGFPHPVFDQIMKRLITCDRYFNFYVSLSIRIVGLLRKLQTCSD